MIEAQKSALIFPDTISAGPEPTPWVHALKNIMRPRFGYDFNVGASLSSPDEHASSYAEWLPWIQEHYGDFYLSREQSSLVGHGLGSPALLRLLERQSRRIDRVYLLSTPLGIGEIGHAAEIESFLGGYEFDWERIRASARAFHIFHGRDDPDVPAVNSETLLERLSRPTAGAPETSLRITTKGGHFNDAAFSLAVQGMFFKVLEAIEAQEEAAAATPRASD